MDKKILVIGGSIITAGMGIAAAAVVTKIARDKAKENYITCKPQDVAPKEGLSDEEFQAGIMSAVKTHADDEPDARDTGIALNI